MKSYPSKSKIRAAIVIVKGDGSVWGVCPDCKEEVRLPLNAQQDEMTEFRERFYVSK